MGGGVSQTPLTLDSCWDGWAGPLPRHTGVLGRAGIRGPGMPASCRGQVRPPSGGARSGGLCGVQLRVPQGPWPGPLTPVPAAVLELVLVSIRHCGPVRCGLGRVSGPWLRRWWGALCVQARVRPGRQEGFPEPPQSGGVEGWAGAVPGGRAIHASWCLSHGTVAGGQGPGTHANVAPRPRRDCGEGGFQSPRKRSRPGRAPRRALGSQVAAGSGEAAGESE